MFPLFLIWFKKKSDYYQNALPATIDIISLSELFLTSAFVIELQCRAVLLCMCKELQTDHLCSLRYFSRRADLKNLPTEVLGMASITA